MSPPRSGIQLYTLRHWDEPLPEIVRRVSEAGFDGVEFAGRALEADPSSVRAALEETDTVPIGAHVPLAQLEESLDETIERFETIGCRRLVVPHIRPEHFRTTSRVDALVDRLHSLADSLEEEGFDLVYHNAREPLLPLLDSFGLERLLEARELPAGVWNHVAYGLGRAWRFDDADLSHRTGFGRLVTTSDSDRLEFEVDAKWAVAAGYSPRAAFELARNRLPVVHVADVKRQRWLPPAFEPADPGTGMVDIGETIAAAYRENVPWIVFEHESPADPETALRQGVKFVASPVEKLSDSR